MKFKVGDRVQCTAAYIAGDAGNYKGAVVVSIARDSIPWPVEVQCDSGGGLFCEDELELYVPKPKRDYVADHARRTLRKAGLTKEEAAAFVRNNKEYDLSTFSRALPESAEDVLLKAFAWHESPEGLAYWNALRRRLLKA